MDIRPAAKGWQGFKDMMNRNHDVKEGLKANGDGSYRLMPGYELNEKGDPVGIKGFKGAMQEIGVRATVYTAGACAVGVAAVGAVDYATLKKPPTEDAFERQSQ